MLGRLIDNRIEERRGQPHRAELVFLNGIAQFLGGWHAFRIEHAAATMEKGRSIAVAGLCPQFRDASVVFAVGVRADEMGKGRGRAIVSFVTNEILKGGRDAVLTTDPTNKAMLRAARAVGFRDTDLKELLDSEIMTLDGL